jgi:hypothetical protein
MTTFNPPYIRDELTIDDDVQKFYDGCTGDGPVVLLGKVVRHATTLRVYRQPLVVVADLYDGTNGIIDARGLNSGAAGGQGATGATPFPPYTPTTDVPVGPGGEGGVGGDGGPGNPGVTVTVYCRRSINAGVSSAGGIGAPGGTGGTGGLGVAGFIVPDQVVFHPDHPDDPSDTSGHEEFIPGFTVEGTSGGGGGPGGNGGGGGNGGTIAFTSVVDETPPSFDVRGGQGGAGGAGGAAGASGNFSPTEAAEGPLGLDGALGADGQVIGRNQLVGGNVTEEEFVAGLLSVLAFPVEFKPYAEQWASYRVEMGEYFYRSYNPSVPERLDFSRQAAAEFARALELQPGKDDATRLQAQLVGVQQEVGGELVWMGGDNNALGLPRDLDVQPDVEKYMGSFVQFSDFALDFLSIGITELAQSVTLQDLTAMAAFQLRQANDAKRGLELDLDIALSEKRLAAEESDRLQQQLNQATVEIQSAIEAMQDSELDIAGLVGKVAAVAGAVVAVAAAIPTAGTSLVALAPTLVMLSETVIQEAGPIAAAVFKGEDIAEVDEAYQKVGKTSQDVVKAGQSVVSFVDAMKRLSAATTSGNPSHVALVRRGIDLTYQVLLARNKTVLAQQRIDAAQAKLARAAATAVEAQRMADGIALSEESVRRTALATIDVLRSKADSLLSMAFRAQRSIEIYTLEPVEGHLLLDAGMIHPDKDRRYREGQIKEPELLPLLQASWLELFEPVEMQLRYLSYFDKPHDFDVLRLSFTDRDPQFGQLLAIRRMNFRVEPTAVPDGRDDAKAVGVRLALVGASHPDNEVSCDVRHGGTYEQRLRGGTIDVQQLKSQVNTRFARFEPLGGDGGIRTDPAPPEVGSLAFWGRGIGGEWDVSIPGSTRNSALDLSGLTTIQVWIGYRFLR